MDNYYKTREHQCITKCKHGVDALQSLPESLAELGVKKPLIVTDPGVVGAGLLDHVSGVLEQGGYSYAVFDQVVPNPYVETVGGATQVYKDNDCDGLIGLGGGSSMDTAKGVGVEATHEGNILDWEAEKRDLERRIAPLITVPTTAGTGSEITVWAVITDPARKFKFNVGGPLLSPHNIHLTREGTELKEPLTKTVEQFSQKAFDGLSENDVEHLRRIQNTILRNLDSHDF